MSLEPRSRVRFSSLLNVTLAETAKVFIMAKRYMAHTIGMVFLNLIMFLGLVLFKTGTMPLQLDQGKAYDFSAFFLIGFLLWLFMGLALNDLSNGIAEEASIGTLEQRLMSPVSPILLLTTGAIASIAINILMLSILAIIIMAITNVRLPLNLYAVPVAGITIIGLYGFGYALAGLTIIFKRVGQLTALLEYMLIFFAGVIVPLKNLPGIVQAIGKVLPLTLGLQALRDISLHGVTLRKLLQSGTFQALALNSALYMVLGVLVFRYCMRLAQQRGSLGQY